MRFSKTARSVGAAPRLSCCRSAARPPPDRARARGEGSQPLVREAGGQGVDRPYRSARTVPVAMGELRANAGTQLCPTVIAAMEALYREQPQMLGAAALRAVGEAAA